MLRVAAISTGPAGVDSAPARHAAEAPVIAAAKAGAGLVVLPELFALPYVAGDDPARWRHLAEPADGATGRWAGALAKRLGIALLFGMALIEGGGKPLNAAMLARADGSLALAAEKINLPPASGAHGEADHFRAGRPLRPLPEIGGARLGIIICYDRRYPECWRALAEAGADLVAVLVAGPAPGDPPGIYTAELRAHARASALPVIAAARCGTETLLGPVRHDGETLAIDADGGILAAPVPAPGATAHLALMPETIAANRALRARRMAGRDFYAIREDVQTTKERNPS